MTITVTNTNNHSFWCSPSRKQQQQQQRLIIRTRIQAQLVVIVLFLLTSGTYVAGWTPPFVLKTTTSRRPLHRGHATAPLERYSAVSLHATRDTTTTRATIRTTTRTTTTSASSKLRKNRGPTNKPQSRHRKKKTTGKAPPTAPPLTNFTSWTLTTARVVAVQALVAAAQTTKGAVERLEANPHFQKPDVLSPSDKAFARMLVSTAERRRGQINKLIHHSQQQQQQQAQQAQQALDPQQPPQQEPTNKKVKGRGRNGRAAGKKKALKPDEAWIHAVLTIGAVQLFFLNVASHAATKETVDVMRQYQKPKSKKDDDRGRRSNRGGGHVMPEAKIGFVNAVLRRWCKSRDEAAAAAAVDDVEGVNLETPTAVVNMMDQYTSITDNMNPWLRKRCRAAWGEAALVDVLQAAMKPSPRCLTVKPHVQERPGTSMISNITEYLLEGFPNPKPVVLPQGSLCVHYPPVSGSLKRWPFYSEGLWWLQDPSATLPARVLASALLSPSPPRRLSVLDMCAAPGGKTAQLACYGTPGSPSSQPDPWWDVTAVEVSPSRVRVLQENLQRLQLQDHVSLVVADGTTWVPEDESNLAPPTSEDEVAAAPHALFDGILLDVPCSATGTAARRPDVLQRTKESLTELLDVQPRLARHAVNTLLKPFPEEKENAVVPRLVYATCSLLPEESEDQVSKLLDEFSGQLETDPIRPEEVPGFERCITPEGWIRVLPGRQSGNFPVDGFFVARLQRKRPPCLGDHDVL